MFSVVLVGSEELRASFGQETDEITEVYLRDLKLERIWVIYPGRERYSMQVRIEALPLLQIYRACSDVLST